MRFRMAIVGVIIALGLGVLGNRLGACPAVNTIIECDGQCYVLTFGATGCTSYTLQRSPAGQNTWTTLSNSTSPVTDCPTTGQCYDYRVACNSCPTNWFYFDSLCCSQ